MLGIIILVIGYFIICGIVSTILMVIDDNMDEVGLLIGLIWPISVPIFLGVAIGAVFVYLVCYLLFDIIGI